MFWVNVPFAVIGLVATTVAVRESCNPASRRLDVPGVAPGTRWSRRPCCGPGRFPASIRAAAPAQAQNVGGARIGAVTRTLGSAYRRPAAQSFVHGYHLAVGVGAACLLAAAVIAVAGLRPPAPAPSPRPSSAGASPSRHPPCPRTRHIDPRPAVRGCRRIATCRFVRASGAELGSCRSRPGPVPEFEPPYAGPPQRRVRSCGGREEMRHGRDTGLAGRPGRAADQPHRL